MVNKGTKPITHKPVILPRAEIFQQKAVSVFFRTSPITVSMQSLLSCPLLSVLGCPPLRAVVCSRTPWQDHFGLPQGTCMQTRVDGWAKSHPGCWVRHYFHQMNKATPLGTGCKHQHCHEPPSRRSSQGLRISFACHAHDFLTVKVKPCMVLRIVLREHSRSSHHLPLA